MWTIFTRVFRDRWLLLLIYIIAGLGLLWMYIAFFPSFKNMQVVDFTQNMPETLMKAFNIDVNNFTTLEGFLSTEQFSFTWPILSICLVSGFAGAAFSGEIEKGTIEILLSQPISRIKVFFSKYFSGIIVITIFSIASIYLAVPIAKLHNINANHHHFLLMTFLGFLFLWAIFGIGMFFSSIFSEKGKVFFSTGALLALMYVLNIVANIKENLNDVKYFSFFYYFNPSKALIYGEIDHWSYLVFVLVAVVFAIMGLIIFVRKDAI